MRKIFIGILLVTILNIDLFSQNLSWTKINGDYNQSVNTISIDSSSNILIGTKKGLYISKDNLKSFEKDSLGISDSIEITSIIVNSKGDRFLGTNGNGIYYKSKNSNLWITFNDSSNYKIINSLLVDSKDNLYASVSNNNNSTLLKFNNIKSYWDDLKNWFDILPKNKILLSKNYNNDIFFNEINNGIIIFKRHNSITNLNEQMLFDPVPNCLISNLQNILFMGTSRSIYKSENNGNTFRYIPLGIGNLSISSIKTNPNNEIIVGTESGQIYYSNTNGESWENNNKGLDSFKINFIEINTNKDIILATYNGLYLSHQAVNNKINLLTWNKQYNYYENKVMEFKIKDLKYSENDSNLFISGDGVIKIISINYNKINQVMYNKFIKDTIPYNGYNFNVFVSYENSDGIIFNGQNPNEKIISYGTLYYNKHWEYSYPIFYKYDLLKDSITNYYFTDFISSVGACDKVIQDFSLSVINNKIYYGISSKCQWKYLDIKGDVFILDSNNNKLQEFYCGLQYLFTFSTDGQFIAYTDLENITIMDSKFKLIAYFPYINEIMKFKFTPDSKYLVGALTNNRIVFWDIKTGQIFRTLTTQSTESISDFEFCKKNDQILSASNDGILRLWNYNLGQCLDSIIFPPSIYNWKISVSNDGNSFATGSDDGIVRLFEFKTLNNVINLLNSYSSLSIFPNPTNDLLQINYTFENNANIKIVNELGEMVYEKKIVNPNNQIQIDTKSFPNGIYLCSINNGVLLETKKFVVMR